MRMQNATVALSPDADLWERRGQARVPAATQVRVVLEGREPFSVQNRDLSWGGASLLLPVPASELSKTLGLEFPCAQGRSFSVRAEVVRADPVGDSHVMVGVRFSKLLVRDEERLERLLGMLMDPKQRAEGGMAERLEMDFLDREDMVTTLTEIRDGELSTVSLVPYQPDQSLLLILAGSGDLPTLQLRARVTAQQALTDGGTSKEHQLFAIDLKFEHPADDLKSTVDPMIRRLSRQRTQLDPAA